MVITQDLRWKVKESSFFNKHKAQKRIADSVLWSKETGINTSDLDSSF